VYLVLLAFELFALDYPAFAVFKHWVLVLGFPGCLSLAGVTSYLVSALFDLLSPLCTHLSLLVHSFTHSGLLLHSLSLFPSPFLSLVLLSF
jgi:hypothetical protein